MAKPLGDALFPIACPNCGHESEEEIARLEADPEFICPGCGVTIQIDAKDLRAKMRSVDEALESFGKALDDFSK